MKIRYLLTLIILVLSVVQLQTAAASSQSIEHIIILWLKEPGNLSAQDTIIKASQSLKTIPGVIGLKSGKAVPSRRRAVDSSFDVALIMSFNNKASLDAYRAHPVHQRLMKEYLMPLVSRIRMYDLR